MASEFEIERRCSYEKRSGIVQLSPTHLVWTPDSNADGDGLQIPITSIRQYQVTKAGSAKKAMIRLVCSDRDGPVKLDFAREFTDRDAVRDVLNRIQTQGAQHSAAPRTTMQAGGSAAAQATPPARPAAPISVGERRWRDKVLAHPEVWRLHAKLVMQSGAVTDDAFWKAMRFKYKQNGELRPTVGQLAEEEPEDNAPAPPDAPPRAGKRKGVPSDAFTAGTDCAMDTASWAHGVPTPAQRHRIFMDFPAVALAHRRLVPAKRSESDFWRCFLASSMAAKLSKNSRVRRNAATATEADAVFAEFQTQERRQAELDRARRAAKLSRSIDLDKFDDHRSAHVLEGHGGTGDAPRTEKEIKGRDLPMTSHLRIMREVNRHGQLIVDAASRGKTVEPWAPGEEERGVPLEDLMEAERPRFATLAVGAIKKAAPVFHDGAAGADGMQVDSDQMHEFVDGLSHWEADTAKLMYPIPTAGSALVELLSQMRP